MKGWNGQEIEFNQEDLNLQFDLNDSGKEIKRKISFDNIFQFSM